MRDEAPEDHHLYVECDSTRLSCAAKIGTAARVREPGRDYATIACGARFSSR